MNKASTNVCFNFNEFHVFWTISTLTTSEIEDLYTVLKYLTLHKQY